ncbi:hypothetical protein OPT61_g10353 [Boeremia exigua]|uniref:Uncharacterized protein n=1 Tax=Boeremia exigua TaxID=749465 RepID=A0ACC2HQG9_9PLEO|nr:hypothetical protein OPT61_g10353 [Boeremia exigua]
MFAEMVVDILTLETGRQPQQFGESMTARQDVAAAREARHRGSAAALSDNEVTSTTLDTCNRETTPNVDAQFVVIMKTVSCQPKE